VAGDQPTFDHLNLVAQDMEATLTFYRRLGFAVPETEPEWSAHHRTLSLPGGFDIDIDSTAFTRVWNGGAVDGGPGSATLICFRLETREAVDRLYADVTAAGYQGQQPPYDAFWGARFAIVADPDGRPVGLMSVVDPARRSPPFLPH
jgi:predicted lactoylglutathione lyase